VETELRALRAENDELRRRIAELEQEAALYKAFFENIPVPAAVHREDGVLVEINRKNREMLAVPSREAAVGKHNMFEDREAVARGYADHLRKAISEELGRTVTMAPASYDTAEAGVPRGEDRRVWTQTSVHGVTVAGVRYAVSVNLDVSERMRAERELEENTTLLHEIIEKAPVIIFVKDTEGRYVLANERMLIASGLTREKVIGKTDAELFPPEVAEAFQSADREALSGGGVNVVEDILPAGDEVLHFMTTKFALRNANGNNQALCCIALDVTARKKAEAETQRLQEEMFRMQAEALRALSTPLLPIAEGVVVMPLIGNLDERRAQQVLETLLEGVVAHQASQVILDVTGVPLVDTHVANALVQAARAVGLLGAKVLLTGIQSAIARTLVDLGADLGSLQTRATLRSGIAQALAARSSIVQR
jgi:PAS domain S-box-containing protein